APCRGRDRPPFPVRRACAMDDAMKRLYNIADADIGTGRDAALEKLAKDRNAFQHYGPTHSIECGISPSFSPV
ncbi:hypothetical protein ABZ565_35100, partial [Streptomyces sp. NPDC016469]